MKADDIKDLYRRANSQAEYIRATLDRRELLEQLAEEMTEAAKAALKLIRAEELNKNWTPVKAEEAYDNLGEEIEDVRLVLALLDMLIVDYTDYPKIERWAKRLGWKE